MDELNSTQCLIVPGLGNSGPNHWQTRWEEQRGDCRRVDLGSWDNPHRSHWATKLDLDIAQQAEPVILVAHSLGCYAVAWWSVMAGTERWSRVAGALLVAPPDVEAEGAKSQVKRFAPLPRCRLPFPSVLVASEDDPFCTLERARLIASRWGASFLNLGQQGHINAESGLGDWPVGQSILERLRAGEIGYRHCEFESLTDQIAATRITRAPWSERWIR
jgi:predicted alpha/beta hydrolase family esterase